MLMRNNFITLVLFVFFISKIYCGVIQQYIVDSIELNKMEIYDENIFNFEPDCIKTVNAGAATVLNQMYEQECALITFSSGVITRDYKFNCCGPSVWIRINGNDWEKIRKEGHLNGLRYQKVNKNDNSYSINFRKMNDKTPESISPEEFLP